MRQSFKQGGSPPVPDSPPAGRAHPVHSLTMVSDFDRLAAMHGNWDSFVETFAPSLYFLMGLLKIFFVDYAATAKDWHPVAFVMSDRNEPLGLATFRIRDGYIVKKPRLFRFRRAEFLLPEELSPDFVARPDCLREFVEGVLPILFKKLGCQSVRLTLPPGSPSTLVLKQWGEGRGMTVRSERRARHAVLRVEGSWEEYLNSLGKKFVQSYRAAERRLDEAGNWGVSCERVDSQAVVDTVLEVDRKSWKQAWKRSHSAGDDVDLLGILNYYRYPKRGESLPLAWILRLNGQPIAFALVFNFRGVAYQPKASYDESYSGLAPGKVLDMKMFQHIFETGGVSQMEFFSFYGYMNAWRPEIQERETLALESYGLPINLLLKMKKATLSLRSWWAARVHSIGANSGE